MLKGATDQSGTWVLIEILSRHWGRLARHVWRAIDLGAERPEDALCFVLVAACRYCSFIVILSLPFPLHGHLLLTRVISISKRPTQVPAMEADERMASKGQPGKADHLCVLVHG